MDEFEQIAHGNPASEPVPDAPADRRLARSPRLRRAVGVFAALSVCAAAAISVALVAGGGSAPRVAAPAAAPTPSDAATGGSCGKAPPIELDVPEGYTTGTVGSSPHADAPAASDQLAITYEATSAPGSVELRWPADANQQASFRRLAGTTTDTMTALGTAATTTKGGTTLQTLVFDVPGRASGCSLVQVTVYGDAGQVKSAIATIATQPVVSYEPLVAATAQVKDPPVVAGCPHVDGTVDPAQTVVVSNEKSEATPEAALAAFVAAHREVLPTGYTELRLPDGSIVYMKEVRPGVVVTALRVVEESGAWTAVEWRRSPC